MLGDTTCQHPSCSTDAEETYSGPNGNTLSLCQRHYYNAVTGGETPTSARISDPPELDDDFTQPFWESRFRCSNTSVNSSNVKIKDIYGEQE